MVANWSELFHDILVEIALKVDTVENYYSFFAVCRSWNHAAVAIKREWKSKVPYLLLAEHDIDNPAYPRQILNFTNNNHLSVKVPEICGARCWGSSFGWLVVIDTTLDIFLFNPLTKSKLSLPPIKPFMNGYIRYITSLRWKITEFIDKAFILRDGDDSRSIVVVIHFGDKERILGFARPNDRTWNLMQTRDLLVHDVVLLNNDKTLLVIYDDGGLGYIDDITVKKGYSNLNDLYEAQNLQLVEEYYYKPPPPACFEYILGRDLYRIYLVESGGDILMVLRYKLFINNLQTFSDITQSYYRRLGIEDENGYEDDGGEGEDGGGDDNDGDSDNDSDSDSDDDYDDEDDNEYRSYVKSVHFEVYKLDVKTKQWEEVKFLRNMSIFVGNHCSVSIDVSNASNFKSNCIYFTDDETSHWDIVALLKKGLDIGCFNMKTGEFKYLFKKEDVQSMLSRALWFTPILV